MNRELLYVIEQIGREKGIGTEVLFEALESALLSASKRTMGVGENVRLTVDRKTGAIRVFAEKNIAQTREFYERSKDAFDKILESWEKTFDAAGQGAVALNRKMVDITQRNINSGFEFAKSLIGAKTLAEMMALHSSYWQKQLGTLRAQADEMRELSTRVSADVVEPVKAQVKRGMDQIERTH